MPRASAPAKVILFGEHAVVYGEPAIAAAADLRITVEVEEGEDGHTVNGHPISDHYHAFLKDAVDLFWDGGPLSFRTETDIPSAAGLGSSAGLAAATVAALAAHGDEDPDEETLARRAYQAEVLAQGDGSPTDTATVVHGGAVLVDREPADGLLWSVDGDDVAWHLHDQPVPDLPLVLGHTGSKGKTGEQVEKVARFVEGSGFADDVIAEIGDITREAVGALAADDRERVGDLMNRNQRNLAILGVSTPHLDRLCEAVEETAYGAKLTGAGGGGCILALTDDPEATAEAIRRQDAEPIPITLGAEGVRLE
jgi:mevalonate kinase